MLGQSAFPGEPTMIDPYTGEEISILATDPYTGRILDMRTGEVVYDPAGTATGMYYKANGTIGTTPDATPKITTDASGNEVGETATDAQLTDLSVRGTAFVSSFASFQAMHQDAIDAGLGDEWESINAASLVVQDRLQQAAAAAESFLGWVRSLFGV